MENLQTYMTKRASEKSRTKQIRKVLVIDSEANSVLPAALARERCHVLQCDCVQKAWRFVYPQRPDLIVFSLRNSDQTALSDLHECRALAGSVPMIVASSVHIDGELFKVLPRGRAAVVEYSAAPKAAAEALGSVAAGIKEH